MQQNSHNALGLPGIFKQCQNEITLHEAILQPSRLNYLKNNHRAELESILFVLIDNLSEAFNVKLDFTAATIIDCVVTILADRDLGQLSPEEIMYVFRCAKTGKYGPVYNKLDCITICGWLRDYMDGERMLFFQQGKTEVKRSEPEAPIAMLESALPDQQRSQLQIIKDQDAAKLRERLKTQMAEFRDREKQREQEKINHE